MGGPATRAAHFLIHVKVSKGRLRDPALVEDSVMTTRDITSIFEGLVSNWNSFRATGAALREFDAIDPETRGLIACEAGLNVADMEDLVARGTGCGALMERMMAGFGLDPDEMRQEHRLLVRDFEILCSRCMKKGRCARELSAGTAVEHAEAFCPNAASFRDLSEGL